MPGAVSPAVLLPEVVHLMRRIETILRGSHSEGVHRRLTTLYAESAIAGGRLAFWGDDRGQARERLKLGARLADELQENQLRALALAFQADLYSGVPYIGTIPGNTNLALSLFAEAASLDAPDWPPLLRSWILGCRAEEYAALKRADDSDRDMDAAHTALAAAQGRPTSDIVVDIAPLDLAAGAFGLSGFEGACALALGRAREARESFERGLKEASSVGRLSGLAAAYALEDDVEAAVELLTEGMYRALTRQLPTRLRRVEGVRVAYLSRAQDHPAVQRFDEQLRAAIR